MKNWQPGQEARTRARGMNSREAWRMHGIRGARASHKAQWARGQIPGAAARAARSKYAAERREAKARLAAGDVKARSGQANVDGI